MLEEPAAETIIQVVLADDHNILRHGLKLLLELQPGIQVIGEARTGIEAVDMALTLKPAVVVMDISMPDMDGLEACRRIRAQAPSIQVLILTMHESEEYFLQSLRAGAAGYVVKKAAPADLHMAIQAVAHGGVFLYPGLAKSLVRSYVEQYSTAPATHNDEQSRQTGQEEQSPTIAQELQRLTPREMEVLKLVAEGHTNQEIADLLVLSIKTVQAHRANVMEKLELHDITQLVRFAIRHRLILVDA
ncbi:MAG TPA: response regulator transcription factor [Ktedonobacteraceae bacterium]|nr:response regulator transcription factor [Ktedonobacteraceae bacterium]